MTPTLTLTMLADAIARAAACAATESEQLREWERLATDPRVRMLHLRLYRWCRVNLIAGLPRKAKRDAVALQTGLPRSHVGRLLSDLVAWSYLTEHEREDSGARRFTLGGTPEGPESGPTQSAPEGRAAA